MSWKPVPVPTDGDRLDDPLLLDRPLQLVERGRIEVRPRLVPGSRSIRSIGIALIASASFLPSCRRRSFRLTRGVKGI